MSVLYRFMLLCVHKCSRRDRVIDHKINMLTASLKNLRNSEEDCQWGNWASAFQLLDVPLMKVFGI